MVQDIKGIRKRSVCTKRGRRKDFKVVAMLQGDNKLMGHESHLTNAIFLWTPSHFSAILIAAASASSITGRLQQVSGVLARRSREGR